MSSLKVNVTKELVERATQRDSRHCMIAEAIKQANPHYRAILVDLATIRWTNPRTGKRYVCLTPEAAGSALVAFDQGHDIEPFTFNVTPIQSTPVVKKGEPQNRGRKKLDPNQMTISGGKPLPTGHLAGRDGADSREAVRMRSKRAEEAKLRGDESNVTRSSRRFRQYGRRLLQA